MKKYIFATDVDGTMLMDNKKVHPVTLEAFKKAQEQGHVVVIATGRSVPGVVVLKEEMPYVDYFICNNGSLVCDSKEYKTTILYGIKAEYFIKIKSFAKENNVIYKVHTNKNTYTNRPEGDYDKSIVMTNEMEDLIEKSIKNNDLQNIFNNETITQLSICAPKDFCTKYYPIFQEWFSDCSIFVANSIYLDINPKNRSKWEGLKDLAQILNIPIENIVTFGDSGNDYEMIAGAKENGYALANSHQDLKEKITPRIGDNNSDAIGVKILEYLEK